MAFVLGTQLLPWLVIAATVGFLLLVAVPSPSRKLRLVTVCALFMAGGLVFVRWQSPKSHSDQQAPARPARPAAPPPPAPPVAAAVPDAAGAAIAIDLGDLNLPDLGAELRGIAPYVRLKNGALVISGDAAPQCESELASQPAADATVTQQLDEAVLALVERALPERLSRYFDELVKKPRKTVNVQELRDLRTTLKALSATQRQRVAEEAAQLRGVVTRYQISTSSDQHAEEQGLRHYAIQAQIQPERIVQLVRTTTAKASRDADAPFWTAALATLGIVVAAAIVLKLTTRRSAV
jgi:hypothetical protein